MKSPLVLSGTRQTACRKCLAEDVTEYTADVSLSILQLEALLLPCCLLAAWTVPSALHACLQVKSGQNQAQWEKAGWITAQDPRGWFQWYCRFYQACPAPDVSRAQHAWQHWQRECHALPSDPIKHAQCRLRPACLISAHVPVRLLVCLVASGLMSAGAPLPR